MFFTKICSSEMERKGHLDRWAFTKKACKSSNFCRWVSSQEKKVTNLLHVFALFFLRVIGDTYQGFRDTNDGGEAGLIKIPPRLCEIPTIFQKPRWTPTLGRIFHNPGWSFLPPPVYEYWPSNCRRFVGDLYSKNFTLLIGFSMYRYANKVQILPN